MTHLSYRRTGDGLPILLLHAMPLDSTMFDTVRDRLDSALTVDCPGFGASPPAADIDRAFGADSPSLDTVAQAVIEDLAELGIDQCILAGLSMGGAIAMAILERAPHIAAGVILMDTNIGADTEDARATRLTAAEKADQGDASSVMVMAETMTSEKTKRDRPAVLRDLTDRLSRVEPSSLAWAQRAMAARPDRRSLIETLEVPLLLARGDADPSCTADMMAGLAQRYPGSASVETIAGAGHFTALETPDDLASLLAQFSRSQ